MKAILLNRVLLVLAFVGLFVAGVLSLEAGLHLVVPCGAGSGCAKVAADPSSKLAGIPVAYLGLCGYLLLAGLAVMRSLLPLHEWRRWVSVGYIVALIGTIFSLYLQYTSFFVIHATCLWCLTSAVTMIVSLIVYAILAQEMDNITAPAPPEEGAETQLPARRGERIDSFLLAGLPAALVIGILLMGMTMKDAAGVKVSNISKVTYAMLVPKGAHMLGPEHAPLTIVEFADLCCPACQRVSPQVKEFVRANPGKIQLVYRHYPLSSLHPQALNAAAIAEVAADDNRFWEYAVGVLSLNRQPNDIEELIGIAKANGVSEDKIRTRLQNTNDPAYARVSRDLATVKELGITSTPTFFMLKGDKLLDTFGPSQIMEALGNTKYQDIINGNGG